MKLLRCGLTFVVAILTANLVSVATTTTLKCLRESSVNCVIPSLVQTNPSEEIHLPDLSKKSSLQIMAGNLSTFSEKLSKQLGRVRKIQLGPLQLKELFLKPELVAVTAEGNRIEVVTFKTNNADYKLQLLDLSENRLRSLDGFEVLVELRELHLEGNALESVDLRVFSGMSKLTKLFLDRNQLTTVLATEPIELPALEYLSLSGNKLTNLDVTNWLVESLTECNISSNDLVYINGLEKQFSNLETISLARNGWACFWLEDTLKYFTESSVSIRDRDGNCDGNKEINNICCVPVIDTDITSDDELSKLSNLERKQNDLRDQLKRKLIDLKREQDKKLKKLEEDLNDLAWKAEKLLPLSATDSLTKQEFEKLKKRAQTLKSSLENEKDVWTKQNKQSDMTKKRLQQTIADQRRSLDREMKKISESKVQFGLLRDYVSSKLTKRS